MFCKVSVDNLNLETSWEFIFAITRISTKYFPRVRSQLATLKFPSHKFPLKYMSGFAFEGLETNFKTLFSRVSLAIWFSTMFCIFICSFPDIHSFLINCNLLRSRNRLWTFCAHFYSFTTCFCLLVLVYQSFFYSALFPTCQSFCTLRVAFSRFFSFTRRFYSLTSRFTF